MQMRKPTTIDDAHQIRIYADGNTDPDYYIVWIAGYKFVVNRMSNEDAAKLYNQVCYRIQSWRWHVPNCNTAIAHVFAGITPTEDDISTIKNEDLRQSLRFMMLNGNTSEDRVNAAITLGELIGMFPTEVNLN